MAQKYCYPCSAQEAVALLKECAGSGRIIAGGTDLLLVEALPSNKSPVLVDLSHIPGLGDIVDTGDSLYIGACVTHNQAAHSELVRQFAPMLAEACMKVGSTQIRNMGTLAGNVVSALPAADAGVALTTLDAVCTVLGPEGATNRAMPEMYLGVGKSAVNGRSHVLTHFSVPKAKPGTGSAYARMEQRKALSLPMLCVGAKLVVEKNSICKVNIIMAPAGPRPVHAQVAEDFLLGKAPSLENFQQAGALAHKNAEFRNSAVRGSNKYRLGILPVFVERALTQAAARAAEGN